MNNWGNITMACIAGANLSCEKRLEVTFIYIYGVGRARAAKTLAATDISPGTRVKGATEKELVKLRDYIEANFKTEDDLRREVQADIRRKTEIGLYQGFRHRRDLSIHGQRIKTDARTREGLKCIVAGKKKVKQGLGERTPSG